jgi:anti-sigma B factor antagonist
LLLTRIGDGDEMAETNCPGRVSRMQLDVEDMPGGICKATLAGRMDIEGASAVDMRFSVLAGAKRALVVDFSGVTFIASMGLRTLMLCARSIIAKGGKMALVNPQPNVEKVLRTSGVHEIIPIHPSFDSAAVAVAA